MSRETVMPLSAFPLYDEHAFVEKAPLDSEEAVLQQAVLPTELEAGIASDIAPYRSVAA